MASKELNQLPKPDIRIDEFGDILPTDGRKFVYGDFYTAEQMRKYAALSQTESKPAEQEPDRNMQGAREFIAALLMGQPIWPNNWGQDVAAAAYVVTRMGGASTTASNKEEMSDEEILQSFRNFGWDESLLQRMHGDDIIKAVRAIRGEQA